jgi:DNA-directed RNA polymerase subunit RPC12/RpoP
MDLMADQHLHDTGSDTDTPAAAAGALDDVPRANPADERAPRGRHAEQTVLTLVCEKCGKDYFFEDEAPPADLACEKCGNRVFRSFHSSVGDEAADDFRDVTERDLRPDDAEGDTMPGDVLDLGRL